MKPEDLYRAIGDVGEDLLERSEAERKKPGRNWRVYMWWAAAAAACLLVAVGGFRAMNRRNSAASQSAEAVMETAEAKEAIETEEAAAAEEEAAPSAEEDVPSLAAGNAIGAGASEAKAEEPDTFEAPAEAEEVEEAAVMDAETADNAAAEASDQVYAGGNAALLMAGDVPEAQAYFEKTDESETGASRSAEKAADSLRAFAASSAKAFLATDMENTLYSPVSLYISLAMLAEVTDGTAQEEILSALGVQSVEEARATAQALWDSNYYTGEQAESKLADSLWLINGESYSYETIRMLAEAYHASTYAGDAGAEEYSAMFREWLNENTDRRLETESEEFSFNPNMMFTLAQAVHYRANFQEMFHDYETQEETFHAKEGDLQVPMMHQMGEYTYIEGDNYSAAALPLADGHLLWLLLPDEGTDPRELLSGDAWAAIANGSEFLSGLGEKDLLITVPKWDISGSQDLEEGLADLGIREIFKKTASYSNLTDEALQVTATQAVRVAVDENGVIADAFTIEEAAAEGAIDSEIIRFTLDRPFLYAVTGTDGEVTFAGIVDAP